MIRKFKYGDPIETEAVVEQVAQTAGFPTFGAVNLEDGFCYRYTLSPDDVVYGLGEAVRGINKHGHRYISNASGAPNRLESTESLYGAHNFLVIAGEKPFGLFVDYPAKLAFDIGYTEANMLEIRCENAGLKRMKKLL